MTEDQKFLMMVGLVIASIANGFIHGMVYGFLSFGGGLIILPLLFYFLRKHG